MNKIPNWEIKSLKNVYSDSEFTPIELSIAAHGIGISSNKIFDNLRKSIFVGDEIYILLSKDKTKNKNKIFLGFKKSYMFFELLSNSSFTKYINCKQKEYKYSKDIIVENNYKTRSSQSQWRELLVNELLKYSLDNSVICPISNIKVDMLLVPQLMRASHIKEFVSCNDITEAYDANNGLLLIANIDVLFDNHYISVNDDGGIILSKNLKDENLIKSLNIQKFLFKPLLNPKRREYLKYHREKFYQLEKTR